MGDLPIWLEILNNSKAKYMPDNTCTYRVLDNSLAHQKSFSREVDFEKSSLKIRTDIAKKYNLNEEIIQKLKIQSDSILFEKAYHYNEFESARNKYINLKGNRSSKIKIQYFVLKSQLLRNIVRSINGIIDSFKKKN